MLASSSTASNLVMNSTGAEKSAGLRLPESKTEIVLQTERPAVEVDMLVDSADAAAIDFERFGGTIIVPAFDIQIGRCVVVEDPWGNRFVLLDMTKGALRTDEQKNVIGNWRTSKS